MNNKRKMKKKKKKTQKKKNRHGFMTVGLQFEEGVSHLNPVFSQLFNGSQIQKQICSKRVLIKALPSGASWSHLPLCVKQM
jgi:hypothetical protein